MEIPNRQTAPNSMYFEDLLIGQQFVSGTHVLDAQQVIKFANEFDPQPFHTDAEAAKNSLFGGLVASGWHTAAITMQLLVGSGLSLAGGIIGAGGEISWPKPTRPDSVLRVVSEIMELRRSKSRPERGIVTIRCETRDQLDEIVQIFTAKLVVPCREA
jgi:acyl dehydratase